MTVETKRAENKHVCIILFPSTCMSEEQRNYNQIISNIKCNLVLVSAGWKHSSLPMLLTNTKAIPQISQSNRLCHEDLKQILLVNNTQPNQAPSTRSRCRMKCR
jgi:hypothetical protein